jgi:Fe2+ or Zn2+ uptake regulation protein
MKNPDTKADIAVSQMRKDGFRVTALRKAITSIFIANKRPISVAELTSALKKNKLSPNKSSIYRELKFLIEYKLVTELDVLEGMKRYEWRSNHDHHHHHIVCTKCGIVECVEICFNEKEIAEKVQKKSGFIVKSHVLEFFGCCPDCH